MSDDRVWLRHKEHGGSWHAPAEAVDAFAEMGWEPGEPPEEFNPVTAEMLAAQRAVAEEAAAAAAAEKKSSRKGGSDNTAQEG